MNISQQFNFTGKLKEDDGEKQQKAITFSLDYSIKKMILNLWQENGTLSVIIQNQIMMQQMKLPIIWKF